jgi:hypothetical protein
LKFVHKEQRVETLGKLRNKILFSVVIGAVVVLVLGVLGEVDKVGEQIGRFRWSLLPATMAGHRGPDRL